jgi:crotonobetainyl-CoA:carnitine CoA-transferase CaiB-like acyl-CoA transferase
LTRYLAARPAREWVELMNAAEIPSGPLYAVDEALNDPHIRSRHMIVQMEHPAVGPFKSLAFPGLFSGTPMSYRMPPPRLGEHTEQPCWPSWAMTPMASLGCMRREWWRESRVNGQ